MDSYEGKHLPVPHCIENTDGHKLYGSVADCVSGEDIVFRKTTFGSDALYEYLKTACYGSVELVGVVTNICVVANAVLAKTALPDADIIVDSTLTASNDERLHNAALDTMEGMQIIIK
jgi:nicotinamidase-related amidase